MRDSHAFPDLAQGFRGQLVSPSDAAYEEARKLYNGMIDKRPRLIARCADVADVITAVNFGREKNMRVAIRGGGHNGPGLGSVDDGLVIDMSAMTGVRVDPVARTARVAAGCTHKATWTMPRTLSGWQRRPASFPPLASPALP